MLKTCKHLISRSHDALLSLRDNGIGGPHRRLRTVMWYSTYPLMFVIQMWVQLQYHLSTAVTEGSQLPRIRLRYDNTLITKILGEITRDNPVEYSSHDARSIDESHCFQFRDLQLALINIGAHEADKWLETIKDRVQKACQQCEGFCCTTFSSPECDEWRKMPSGPCACRHLKEGKCGTYESRPWGCKEFACRAAVLLGRAPTREEYFNGFFRRNPEFAQFHLKLVEIYRANPEVIHEFLSVCKDLQGYEYKDYPAVFTLAEALGHVEMPREAEQVNPGIELMFKSVKPRQAKAKAKAKAKLMLKPITQEELS